MFEYQLERAWSLYHSGQYTPAIDQLKNLLGQDPNHAESHGLLAACLLGDKRLHAAEYELHIALQQDPMQPFLFLIQSKIFLYKRQFNKALESCDHTLSIAPTYVDALLEKSGIYLLQDNFDKAQTSIEQAASIAPDHTGISIAFAHLHLARGDYQQAATFAREALQQNAQSESANLLMGRIQLAQGNLPDAEYHAKFVILNSPNSEEALALLANIKARKNWFIGLWWRFNNKLVNMSQLRQVSYLICAYLFFNLLSQIVEDIGYPRTSSLIGYAWLALVIYSWIAIPIYIKMLKKELQRFQFNRDF
jgi:tetratricopeptide (TPR) repeat protein